MQTAAVLLLLSVSAVVAAPVNTTYAALEMQLNSTQRLFSYANNTGLLNPATYGQVKQLSIEQFPAFSLSQTPGVAELYFSFQPCTMFAPHHHPRGDETVHGITGRTKVGVLNEAVAGHGVNLVELGMLDATFAPQGSMHYYINDYCDPSSILAIFNNGDPGTVMAVDSLLTLSDGLLATAFGVKDDAITSLRKAITPMAIQPSALFRPLTDPECYRRCNLAVPS